MMLFLATNTFGEERKTQDHKKPSYLEKYSDGNIISSEPEQSSLVKYADESFEPQLMSTPLNSATAPYQDLHLLMDGDENQTADYPLF